MTIREEFRAYLNESDYDDKQAKALYSFIKKWNWNLYGNFEQFLKNKTDLLDQSFKNIRNDISKPVKIGYSKYDDGGSINYDIFYYRSRIKELYLKDKFPDEYKRFVLDSMGIKYSEHNDVITIDGEDIDKETLKNLKKKIKEISKDGYYADVDNKHYVTIYTIRLK